MSGKIPVISKQHVKKGHQLSNKRMCYECNREIAKEEIHKIIDTGNGTQIFTKEQVDGLKDYEKTIKVIGTVKIEDIDPRRITEGHYLLPRQAMKGASKKAKDSVSLPDYAVLQQSLINAGVEFLLIVFSAFCRILLYLLFYFSIFPPFCKNIFTAQICLHSFSSLLQNCQP